MTTALMNMSLDEIIKQRKTTPLRKRGRGPDRFQSIRRNGPTRTIQRRKRGAPYGSISKIAEMGKGDPDGVWSHDLYDVHEGKGKPKFQGKVAQSQGGRVYVSGLDYEVLPDELKDIFAEIGEVRSAEIHFDKTDRSKGTGEVQFALKSHAEEAVRKMNGLQVNGKPIRVRLSTNSVPSGTSSSTATSSSTSTGFQPSGLVISNSGKERKVLVRGRGNTTAVVRGEERKPAGFRRNRGGFRGGRGRGGGTRKVASKEELDADIDDYQKMNE